MGSSNPGASAPCHHYCGCEHSSCCSNCPLPMCKHDPGFHAVMTQDRHRRILDTYAVTHAPSYTARMEAVAASVGVSRRTVLRALAIKD